MNLKIDEKTLTWITDRWERKSTILILMIVVFLVLIIKFSGSNLSDISLSELVFILGITVLLYLIWLFSIRIPTNKKNHFGFCIAIKSETKSQSDKIKSDFINILQNLLDIKSEVFKYNIVLLPDHLTKKIKNNTKAKQYLFKTKCHFMIYGFTRVREINGTDVHLLNMDAIVAHRSVPPNIKKHLEQEFGELFPRKLLIEQDNDAFKFEFTSQWMYISLQNSPVVSV